MRRFFAPGRLSWATLTGGRPPPRQRTPVARRPSPSSPARLGLPNAISRPSIAAVFPTRRHSASSARTFESTSFNTPSLSSLPTPRPPSFHRGNCVFGTLVALLTDFDKRWRHWSGWCCRDDPVPPAHLCRCRCPRRRCRRCGRRRLTGRVVPPAVAMRRHPRRLPSPAQTNQPKIQIKFQMNEFPWQSTEKVVNHE